MSQVEGRQRGSVQFLSMELVAGSRRLFLQCQNPEGTVRSRGDLGRIEVSASYAGFLLIWWCPGIAQIGRSLRGIVNEVS